MGPNLADTQLPISTAGSRPMKVTTRGCGEAPIHRPRTLLLPHSSSCHVNLLPSPHVMCLPADIPVRPGICCGRCQSPIQPHCWSEAWSTWLPPAGDRWRINFSRVHWNVTWSDEQQRYVKQPPDRPGYNWVWSPQWQVQMHQPETWGYVQFTDTKGEGA